VPWCCVFSIALAVFSLGNTSLSVIPAIDLFVHAVLIPVSFGVHALLGIHIYRSRKHAKHCSHKKSEHVFFWLSVSLLVLSTLFHLSPWHSKLLGL
jgi:hypothetical protein